MLPNPRPRPSAHHPPCFTGLGMIHPAGNEQETGPTGVCGVYASRPAKQPHQAPNPNSAWTIWNDLDGQRTRAGLSHYQ